MDCKNLLKICSPSEHQIQMAYVRFCRFKPWGKSIFHIPNEFPFNFLNSPAKWGYLRKRRNLGMRKGVSDLFLPVARSHYHGAFIEIKKYENKLNENQQAFFKEMQESGYYTIEADNLSDLIKKTEEYINLKN